jgi:hypothetical protein
VTRIEWDDIVEAFSAYRSNQPFAMGVGRGHANGRFQHVYAPALNFFIQTGRERLVPIMKEKPRATLDRQPEECHSSCCA